MLFIRFITGSYFLRFLPPFVAMGFFLSPLCICGQPAWAPEAPKADSWSFGQSVDRHDKIWKKGAPSAEVARQKLSSEEAGPEQQPKEKIKAVDTHKSLEKSLITATNKEAKGKVGLNVKQESSSWLVAPQQKEMRADEKMSRDKRHIFSAYAAIEKIDDFTISLGPEWTIKSEQNTSQGANDAEPDQTLGLGMKFQFDF